MKNKAPNPRQSLQIFKARFSFPIHFSADWNACYFTSVQIDNDPFFGNVLYTIQLSFK